MRTRSKEKDQILSDLDSHPMFPQAEHWQLIRRTQSMLIRWCSKWVSYGWKHSKNWCWCCHLRHMISPREFGIIKKKIILAVHLIATDGIPNACNPYYGQHMFHILHPIHIIAYTWFTYCMQAISVCTIGSFIGWIGLNLVFLSITVSLTLSFIFPVDVGSGLDHQDTTQVDIYLIAVFLYRQFPLTMPLMLLFKSGKPEIWESE